MNEIFERLCRDAAYAIRSNSTELVYQCYGATKMAKTLKGISKEEYEKLHRALIPGWMNNVAKRKELSKTITWEDIAR